MILQQNAPSNPVRPNSCDSEIAKYLLLAQTVPQGSREQKKAFERLVYHLKPHLRCKNSHYVSQQDHEEAVNDTLLAVHENLPRLTASHIGPFAKKVLSNKLVDKIRKEKRKQGTVSLDESMSDGETSFLETIAQPEPDPLIVALKYLIDKDPDQMLQNSMRGRPDLSWQWMLQHRLQGQWKELAQISGKSISSLNSFDKREIKRLTPYLQKALSS